jgi:hypothetical protein
MGMGKSTRKSLIGFLGFIALAGSCYACQFGWHQRIGKDERHRQRHDPSGARPRIADTAGPLSGLPRGSDKLRQVDHDALAMLRRPVTGPAADISAGKPWLIRGSADGARRFVRLQIDLDRSGEVDERWEVQDDDSVVRRVLARTHKDGTTTPEQVFVLVPGADDWAPTTP